KTRGRVFRRGNSGGSPSPKTSPICCSSASRTRTVNSVTDRIRRSAGVSGRLSSCGPGSSSSNGRSKRSLIGQIDELIETVTETLDVHGTPGFLVRFDDDGVQARVAGRGFELRRQRVEEAAERRVDVDAD